METKYIKIPFTKIDSDAFLELDMKTQLYFFYLCTYADSNGKVRNPKAIARGLNIPEEAVGELIRKGYISYELLPNDGVEINGIND